MHDILSVYNYKIVTVGSQSDFFRKAQIQKPSIIVINEMFAQHSGNEMLSLLRNDPQTADIPVIFIYGDTPVEQQLNQYQFDNLTEIVHEPVKIKNLRHYIDRWTTLRSLYIKH